MGRSEAPIDPDKGPLQQFACELRRLRDEAGRPPYRVLAERARYSIAALSQAASGRALPSLPVTLGFVRACGGDPEEWERRWHAVNAALRAGEAASVTEAEAATEAESAAPVPAAAVPVTESAAAVTESAPPVPEPAALPRNKRTARWVTGAAAVCIVAATTVVWLHFSGGSGASSNKTSAKSTQPCPMRTAEAGQPEPVADCSDPGRAGCGAGAITLASANVRFPVDQLSGEIQLRYSPKCQSAWGRFAPSDGWRPGPGMKVKVWTVRPADKAFVTYEVEFGTEAIIGDMLMTQPGCVIAEVTMARGAEQSPTATTACMPVSN